MGLGDTPLNANKWNLKLYWFLISPPSNKIAAWLNYHNVPYKTIEVNIMSKKEIEFSKDYKKVPILRYDDNEFVVDSSVILADLEKRYFDREMTADEKEWSTWVNRHFMWAFEYRMFRTTSSAWSVFRRYTLEKGEPFLRRYILPAVNSLAVPWFLPKICQKQGENIDDRALAAALVKIGDEVERRKTPFLGGAKPSLADIEIFGTMQAAANSMFLTQLLVGAPANFANWYDQMERQIYNGTDWAHGGKETDKLLGPKSK